MKPTPAVARAFLLFTLGPAVFAPARVLAQDAPVATATRVEEAPTIDGILDDASWMAGSSLGDFVQRDPIPDVAPRAAVPACLVKLCNAVVQFHALFELLQLLACQFAHKPHGIFSRDLIAWVHQAMG